MSNKVPESVAKEVKECVYREANKCNYLSRTRTDNGTFLANLVAMQPVGGRLSQFMSKAEIRTYIKDAILNRYSKDITQEEKPNNLEALLNERFGKSFVESDLSVKDGIILYKAVNSRHFVVTVNGTVLKWETALRKALLYIASKPFSSVEGTDVSVVLTLFARRQKIAETDKKLLNNALCICKGQAYIYGEG